MNEFAASGKRTSADLVAAQTVYKIIERDAWAIAEADGVFAGAEIDLKDGFIHFSTGDQVASTAALHFVGREDLVLVAVDARELAGRIVYEEARGGALFPHLYEKLSTDHVIWAKPMPLGADGKHVLPQLQA